MRNAEVLDLAQCSEFRQSLEARPPRIAHAAAYGSLALVVAALVWAGTTRASLVVRAMGRVRPIT